MKMGQKKRILVVLPRHGGSRSLGENILYALVKMGHEATAFDFGKYREGLGRLVPGGSEDLLTDLSNQALVVKALEIKADLVLVMALAPVSPFTVKVMRNGGLRTAHYFCEDLRAADHWKPIISAYDDFYIIQKDPWLSELRSRHNPRTHYLPHGAPLENLEEPVVPKEFNAVFVGAPYANRVRFFEKLCIAGADFKIFGWGWDRMPLSPALKKRLVEGTKWLSHAEIASIFNRSRMVINLHSTLTGAEVDPQGDFINPRAFMVPLCRSLQLVDRRISLSEFFAEDLEIACFGSVAELAEKMAHFQAHPAEADAIIIAAREKTLANHLLSRRLEQVLAPAGSGATAHGILELVGISRARARAGEEMDDDDFIHLLAGDIMEKRSSGEEEHA